MTDVRSFTDVLADSIELADADVLDVGCGAGELVRWLRSRGARALGAECGAHMLALARVADPAHRDSYVEASGQDLPFEADSFDLVIFSYSLHHVPLDEMPAALGEARRVLRHGGTLYVVEPEPASPDNVAAYPAIDERSELAAAQVVIDRARDHGFEPLIISTYASEGIYESFESWVAEMVGVDPDRAESVARHRAQLYEQFHRLGRTTRLGHAFDRGNRLAVFTAV